MFTGSGRRIIEEHRWGNKLESCELCAGRDLRTLLPVPVKPAPPCRLCCVVEFDLAPSKESLTLCPFNHVILDPEGTPVTIEEEPIGRIQAYKLGYERELPVGLSWLSLGLGVQASTYGLPPQLKTVYGARPSMVAVFLRLRPTGNVS